MTELIKDLKILEEPAEPLEFLTEKGIDRTEGDKIIKQLKEVLEANTTMTAIAAPQIGIKKRIFCVRFNDIIKTFINPIITKKNKFTISPEVFSSMPGKEILISRPEEVTVVYYTDDYKYEDNKLLGAAAKLFDQQFQLLDGVLPSELGLVSDVKRDGSLFKLKEEELQQLVEVYQQFIAAKHKGMQQDLQAQDEEIKKDYTKLKFTEDVINDRTQIVTGDHVVKHKPQKGEGKIALNNFLRRKHK